jgi:hypothetical protein
VGRAIAAGDSENLGSKVGESGPARFDYRVQWGSFGTFAFLEFIQLYTALPADIRLKLDGILSLV